jgi:predicted transcriptional regulator
MSIREELHTLRWTTGPVRVFIHTLTMSTDPTRSSGTIDPDPLTRREREMMDILYAGGLMTAREIGERMASPPTDATVRTILRVLERKGHVRRRARGKAHEYEARRPARSAARAAVRRLVDVFFGGSVERAVSGLLDAGERRLTAEELERLERLIRETKSQTSNS